MWMFLAVKHEKPLSSGVIHTATICLSSYDSGTRLLMVLFAFLKKVTFKVSFSLCVFAILFSISLYLFYSRNCFVASHFTYLSHEINLK